MSTTGREVRRTSGFGRSDQHTFTIGSGANGSAVAAVDLARNYSFIVIACDAAIAEVQACLRAHADVWYARLSACDVLWAAAGE